MNPSTKLSLMTQLEITNQINPVAAQRILKFAFAKAPCVRPVDPLKISHVVPRTPDLHTRWGAKNHHAHTRQNSNGLTSRSARRKRALRSLQIPVLKPRVSTESTDFAFFWVVFVNHRFFSREWMILGHFHLFLKHSLLCQPFHLNGFVWNWGEKIHWWIITFTGKSEITGGFTN